MKEIEPEYLDSKGVEEKFSIKRSLLYDLLNQGKIESVSLIRDDQARGKRLFKVAAIRKLLEDNTHRGPINAILYKK